MRSASFTLSPKVTEHAVQRFQERVDRCASAAAAREQLERLVVCGRARSTPRHWMKSVKAGAGLQFFYWSELPGVAALVIDGKVVTTLTRQLFRGHTPKQSQRTRPAPLPARSERRWRWDGQLEDAA